MRRATFLIVVVAAVALALPGAAAAACQPSAAHPSPVILVHGTFLNSASSWNELRPLLQARGFCVLSIDYANNATAPMARSGDQLAGFARQVLAHTGQRSRLRGRPACSGARRASTRWPARPSCRCSTRRPRRPGPADPAFHPLC